MRILFLDQTSILSPTLCHSCHLGSESVRAWDSASQWTQQLVPDGEEKTANSPAAEGERSGKLTITISTSFSDLYCWIWIASEMSPLFLLMFPITNCWMQRSFVSKVCAQVKRKDSRVPWGTAGLHFPHGEGRQTKLGPGQKLMQINPFSKLQVDPAGSPISNDFQIAIWDWNCEKWMLTQD